MPEFVHNEPSLVEARKKFLRGAKNIKRTAAARKATRDAKKPRPQKIVPGTQRAAIKQHVPAKKSWLTQPVKIRKIAPSAVSKAVSRAPVLPTSRISVAPLKGMKVAPVGGYVPGTKIPWEPVISSNVGAIAHDDKENVLWIRFLDASIYRYEGFTGTDMALFRTSTSKGSHVWTHIRDKFEYQRIE